VYKFSYLLTISTITQNPRVQKPAQGGFAGCISWHFCSI